MWLPLLGGSLIVVVISHFLILVLRILSSPVSYHISRTLHYPSIPHTYVFPHVGAISAPRTPYYISSIFREQKQGCASLYIPPHVNPDVLRRSMSPRSRSTNGTFRLWERLTLVDVFLVLVCAARCRKLNTKENNNVESRSIFDAVSGGQPLTNVGSFLKPRLRLSEPCCHMRKGSLIHPCTSGSRNMVNIFSIAIAEDPITRNIAFPMPTGDW